MSSEATKRDLVDAGGHQIAPAPDAAPADFRGLRTAGVRRQP
jgi:hypothetical protein